MEEMKRMVGEMARAQQAAPGLVPIVTASQSPVPEVVITPASNYAGVVRGRGEAPGRTRVPAG